MIENIQVTGLPLDGRNFFELSLLLAGVAPPAPGSAGTVRGDFAVNVNGAREDSNNFLLDGVFNGDPKLNGIGVTPPVDAVREFEVVTSTSDASLRPERRRPVECGAEIRHQLLSRDGLRVCSETARWMRGTSLPRQGRPARSTSATSSASPRGGPVVRNRTFFFADYEGRRVREGITQVTNVPSAMERTGNFSRSGLYAIDLFTQSPFPGNVIPKERLHPVGLAIASLYPLPNRSALNQDYVVIPDFPRQ